MTGKTIPHYKILEKLGRRRINFAWWRQSVCPVQEDATGEMSAGFWYVISFNN